MNITLDHWHIEVSSICTLKCPRCTRTEVPKTLLNRSLDLKFFQEQIGQEKISQTSYYTCPIASIVLIVIGQV